uniref:Uncharacterized protein n=1 Tax=Chromera velia CCMP2878 TaxID=1169474 RepID=A0A0G4I3M6_9ALVE|mmetsp:Transcript_23547/g.46279  ORF Transcript_23547/g.46279 Transcript_23547/m.46279 type:complete len:443 (+) Transcript_23547:189-1517(+)|eukprot:Cvel_10712.t1-p1 / transcript=Cvel_10712.t1 / gene=Cvel_10712 / organism=Chromera_velia_CCMP2878 / gene_product=hypothetical protein / transcript_product=hypothetical protein / location=Cvel_scaffold651:69637-73446(-) / protein_length=442 / sequence_SO=supercontig / SO=protein_coding / is_pseudo=false
MQRFLQSSAALVVCTEAFRSAGFGASPSRSVSRTQGAPNSRLLASDVDEEENALNSSVTTLPEPSEADFATILEPQNPLEPGQRVKFPKKLLKPKDNYVWSDEEWAELEKMKEEEQETTDLDNVIMQFIEAEDANVAGVTYNNLRVVSQDEFEQRFRQVIDMMPDAPMQRNMVERLDEILNFRREYYTEGVRLRTDGEKLATEILQVVANDEGELEWSLPWDRREKLRKTFEQKHKDVTDEALYMLQEWAMKSEMDERVRYFSGLGKLCMHYWAVAACKHQLEVTRQREPRLWVATSPPARYVELLMATDREYWEVTIKEDLVDNPRPDFSLEALLDTLTDMMGELFKRMALASRKQVICTTMFRELGTVIGAIRTDVRAKQMADNPDAVSLDTPDTRKWDLMLKGDSEDLIRALANPKVNNPSLKPRIRTQYGRKDTGLYD